jgi:hypothetical protein
MRLYLYRLRVFSAFLLLLMGLGLVLNSDPGQKFVGAVLAAAGLTFFWVQVSKY